MCSRYNWPRWILAPSPSIKDAWELKQQNIKAGVPRVQRTDLDASPQLLHFKDARELKQKNIKAGVHRRNGPTWMQPPGPSLKDAWELKQKNIKAGMPRA